MALWDDVPSLLTRLRHTFITSDDTGLCEMVITDEVVTKNDWNINEHCFNVDEPTQKGKEKISVSPDIYPEMEYGARRLRRRSQTDERLEKLKRDKLGQSTDHIQWKSSAAEFSAPERDELFCRKEIKKAAPAKKSSALSLQLEQVLPDNPFRQYAKFDSKANRGSHARSLGIYLTMCEDKSPMSVVVLNAATVRDTIGLICWQYTSESRQPALNENVDLYELYMEDCGQPDTDFPPIDKREPISKFGFSKLAMVLNELPKTPKKTSQYYVTVHISTKGMTKVQVDDLSIPMRDILDKVMKRRVGKETLGKKMNYNLERYNEPGIAIDLSQTLCSMNTMEFFMVRENSARGVAADEHVNDGIQESFMADSLSAFQYKLYKPFYMTHKLLPQKKEFNIGVSRDQIEIHQLSKSRPGKSKTAQHAATMVAGCEVVELKQNKASFRFIYMTANKSLEHHDFEGETALCMEIVAKINHIVDYISSPVRTDYLKSKGDKNSHRRSLNSES